MPDSYVYFVVVILRKRSAKWLWEEHLIMRRFII